MKWSMQEMKNLGNEEKRLTAERRLLIALASTGSPVGFNMLQKKACLSSKTVAEHLKVFVPKLVEKMNGKYCLTNQGKEYMKNLEQELNALKQYKESHFPPEIVEVYSIGPSYSCRGTLEVSYPRRLLLDERASLDKAITQAVHHDIQTVMSTIPKGCRCCKISINWYSRR
jgi:hypothetical protein